MPSCHFPRLALGACAVLLSSCRGDRSDTDTSEHVLTVTAADYSFEAPAETPAGLTTIRLINRGPSPHHIQLVKLAEGKRLEDLLGALKGEAFPEWATMAGGPAPPEIGQTSTLIQMLEPGTYALICFIPAADGMPHVMKGMSRELRVVGQPSGDAGEPKADIVAKLVDYDFELSAPITAGRHIIKVENAGPQPHEIVLIRLEPGKTPEDFARWGLKQEGPPPGTVHGGVSGIMPGAHVFVEVDLPPGEYGLLCFLPDAKDGKPHFLHGMARSTTVSS